MTGHAQCNGSECGQNSRQPGDEVREIFTLKIDGYLRAFDREIETAEWHHVLSCDLGSGETLYGEHRPATRIGCLDRCNEPEAGRECGGVVEDEPKIRVPGISGRIVRGVAPDPSVRLYINAGCAIDHLGNRHRIVLCTGKAPAMADSHAGEQVSA